MIILIAGASHTGKTLLAQRLLEKYGVECTLIDGTYQVDIGGDAE